MMLRMVFLASASMLVVGVEACGSSSDEGDGSSGNGGTHSGSGGSNSAGTSSTGGNSGSSGKSSGGTSSGTAGVAATGGDAGTNTGGTAGSSACPPALPPSRSPCSVPSLKCSYGQTVCNCVVMLGEPGGMSWFCGDSGGSGGSGGSSGDPCGDCAEGERCILQGGGPGPSRFRCAQDPPCTLAGECACITGEGTCSYQNVTVDAGVVELCVCDNGLD